MADTYNGYIIVDENDENLPNLYTDKSTNWYNLLENQYIVIVNANGEDVDIYKWQDGKHKKVVSKSLESLAIGKIKPMNIEQKLAIDMLTDPTITVKVLAGRFGSGKDLLMASAAFTLMQAGKAQKIMWVRNNVEVKDSCTIGHLPGSLFEKIKWTAGPLIDHLGGEDALEQHIENGDVELQHLGHIRGRDIRNTLMICSEAENLSRSHIQLLLGRVAEGSALFINGDMRQVDARVFEVNNGLKAAIDCLKGNRLFSYVYMPHSVRSETAKLADLLD